MLHLYPLNVLDALLPAVELTELTLPGWFTYGPPSCGQLLLYALSSQLYWTFVRSASDWTNNELARVRSKMYNAHR